MAKTQKAENHTVIGEVLETWKSEMDNPANDPLVVPVTKDILSSLSHLVNPDICLSAKQISTLRGMVAQRVSIMMEGGTTDNQRLEAFEVLTLQLATYVNTVRNECNHCLTRDCAIRDYSQPCPKKK